MSIIMITLIGFCINYLYQISKDINNNYYVESREGTIIDSQKGGLLLIIDKKIYPCACKCDIENYYDYLSYHIDNEIEVTFYYYKYSKCIQTIEWQEIPEEEQEDNR